MDKTLFQQANDAYTNLKNIVNHTPTAYNNTLSSHYQANIYIKREDLQIVRSYKLRGAYNKMRQIQQQENTICYCSSAGNHAQGVAYSCAILKIKGKIFMPNTTPKQKIKKVKQYGGEWVEIILCGDTYDDAYQSAMEDCSLHNGIFIHPFDDYEVIAGQSTVAIEILNDMTIPIDYIFVPIGGGGLLGGVITIFKQLSPQTKIIGVEPQGAASMKAALEQGKVVSLDTIDGFVDGAAVKKVGQRGFEMAQKGLDDLIVVPEGCVSSTILSMYNEEAIVVEPAGALSIAALRQYSQQIKGKTVVCILSGGNNDIVRTEEIKERSLLYEGLKHYFIVQFPQRPGALRLFLSEILGENDDISYFQYAKKNSKESGPVVIGIELKDPADFHTLIERMKAQNFSFTYLNDKPDLFTHLIG